MWSYVSIQFLIMDKKLLLSKSCKAEKNGAQMKWRNEKHVIFRKLWWKHVSERSFKCSYAIVLWNSFPAFFLFLDQQIYFLLRLSAMMKSRNIFRFILWLLESKPLTLKAMFAQILDWYTATTSNYLLHTEMPGNMESSLSQQLTPTLSEE